jgi:hypothetical protein
VGFSRQAGLQCAALVRTTYNNETNIEIKPRQPGRLQPVLGAAAYSKNQFRAFQSVIEDFGPLFQGHWASPAFHTQGRLQVPTMPDGDTIEGAVGWTEWSGAFCRSMAGVQNHHRTSKIEEETRCISVAVIGCALTRWCDESPLI